MNKMANDIIYVTSVNASKLITCVVATTCIVYGCFRSLKLDEKKSSMKDKSDDKSGLSPNNSVDSCGASLSTGQVILIPLSSSICLLIIFFFFESIQLVVVLCTAGLATVAFAFLLHPICNTLAEPCFTSNRISFGPCGRSTPAEIISGVLSFCIVMTWILTGHWLLMDMLGMSLCIAFIAYVRLPSLKVSTLLLTGLLIYDVFWVFFSSRFFRANVMVNVATKEAQNPFATLARKLNFEGYLKDRPKLSLPGKLVFPNSSTTSDHFSILGLGDIVMPGLLLCFVLRFDWHKRLQLQQQRENAAAAGAGTTSSSTGSSAAADVAALEATSRLTQRITYFHCSLIGYFLGLMTATVSSEVFRSAQPALLYLVPFTLLPLLVMAYLKGELGQMWSRPFAKILSQPKIEV